MAKYQSKQFIGQKPVVLPDDATAEWATIDIEFPSTAILANDLLQLVDIPISLKVLDWAIQFPDIDSGGSALAFSLGVENAGGTDLGSEVWGTALAAGAAGATVRNALAACAQGDSTVVRRLSMKCTTPATTYAGAGKVGQVILLLQG